jgi:hypothetical protein
LFESPRRGPQLVTLRKLGAPSRMGVSLVLWQPTGMKYEGIVR